MMSSKFACLALAEVDAKGDEAGQGAGDVGDELVPLAETGRAGPEPLDRDIHRQQLEAHH